MSLESLLFRSEEGNDADGARSAQPRTGAELRRPQGALEQLTISLEEDSTLPSGTTLDKPSTLADPGIIEVTKGATKEVTEFTEL